MKRISRVLKQQFNSSPKNISLYNSDLYAYDRRRLHFLIKQQLEDVNKCSENHNLLKKNQIYTVTYKNNKNKEVTEKITLTHDIIKRPSKMKPGEFRYQVIENIRVDKFREAMDYWKGQVYLSKLSIRLLNHNQIKSIELKTTDQIAKVSYHFSDNSPKSKKQLDIWKVRTNQDQTISDCYYSDNPNNNHGNRTAVYCKLNAPDEDITENQGWIFTKRQLGYDFRDFKLNEIDSSHYRNIQLNYGEALILAIKYIEALKNFRQKYANHHAGKQPVHRDLHQGNFKYDPKTRTGTLIDFDLAGEEGTWDQLASLPFCNPHVHLIEEVIALAQKVQQITQFFSLDLKRISFEKLNNAADVFLNSKDDKSFVDLNYLLQKVIKKIGNALVKYRAITKFDKDPFYLISNRVIRDIEKGLHEFSKDVDKIVFLYNEKKLDKLKNTSAKEYEKTLRESIKELQEIANKLLAAQTKHQGNAEQTKIECEIEIQMMLKNLINNHNLKIPKITSEELITSDKKQLKFFAKSKERLVTAQDDFAIGSNLYVLLVKFFRDREDNLATELKKLIYKLNRYPSEGHEVEEILHLLKTALNEQFKKDLSELFTFISKDIEAMNSHIKNKFTGHLNWKDVHNCKQLGRYLGSKIIQNSHRYEKKYQKFVEINNNLITLHTYIKNLLNQESITIEDYEKVYKLGLQIYQDPQAVEILAKNRMYLAGFFNTLTRPLSLLLSKKGNIYHDHGFVATNSVRFFVNRKNKFIKRSQERLGGLLDENQRELDSLRKLITVNASDR